jgi:hypothetical protein
MLIKENGQSWIKKYQYIKVHSDFKSIMNALITVLVCVQFQYYGICVSY